MGNFAEIQVLCIKIFQEVAQTCSVLVLPLFLGRIVFSNVVGSGEQILSSLKGAVLYFVLIAGFPFVLEILFSIPESYLPKWGELTSNSDFEGVSVIPFALDQVLEVLLAGLYWVAYYLHVFFMLIMSSMAPVIFLMTTILGAGIGLEIFFGLLIVGSSWPIVWRGFDLVHAQMISQQSDAFAAKCLEVLVTLFKGISPVALAATAVKSSAGKVVTKAAQGTISAGKWTVLSGPNAFRSSQLQYRKVINRFSSSQNQKSRAISGERNFMRPERRLRGDGNPGRQIQRKESK